MPLKGGSVTELYRVVGTGIVYSTELENNPEKPETESPDNSPTSEVKVPDGFTETKEFGRQHGQKVYKKGTKYISRDIGQKNGTSHNGGVWKEFKRSGNRLIRTGTLDENLQRIKD